MNKILLIDGNSLTYRAYYGSAYSPSGILTNSQGIPINAVMTLSRMLEKTINKYQPTHVFIAFDAGKHTNRHDKLPSYKAGRSKTPEELIVQMPLVKEMIQKMGIPCFELKGIEADDIVGTAATIYSKENQVLVLSSDKDLYQLVNENVTVIVPQNGSKEDKIIEYHTFKDAFGYMPHQVPDVKGIVGDPSDNLKGVEGIGSKGALDLIQKYTNLEGIYENIENITGAKQDKLKTSREMAFLCKEIATIQRDVEIPFLLEDMKYDKKVNETLINFFEKLEIPSLVKYYQDEKVKHEKTEEISLDNLML